MAKVDIKQNLINTIAQAITQKPNYTERKEVRLTKKQNQQLSKLSEKFKCKPSDLIRTFIELLYYELF